MAGSVIQRSPRILSGTAVFAGTRVPVQTFIDYLEAGKDLDEFLDDFPTVQRNQLVAVLEEAKHVLVAESGG
jgi:uncharacterized protein (DUF433 family)